MLNLILPTVHADYTAIETYRYDAGPALCCDVTAMVGDHDPKTSIDEASAWSAHTTGAFDLQVYPGDHFYLDDCRAGVLDAISSRLSGAVTGVRQGGGRG
jgi:surfactin synthase thioesterase subunit